jgi:hypothetical protein
MENYDRIRLAQVKKPERSFLLLLCAIREHQAQPLASAGVCRQQKWDSFGKKLERLLIDQAL